MTLALSALPTPIVVATIAPPLFSFCDGKPVTIRAVAGVTTFGTNGPDVIRGTSGPDLIFARAGNDTVCALDGDDEVHGGHDADVIDGGDGDDRLYGEE